MFVAKQRGDGKWAVYQTPGLTANDLICTIADHNVNPMQTAIRIAWAWNNTHDVCGHCGGSGGGDDPAIRCNRCDGTGNVWVPTEKSTK